MDTNIERNLDITSMTDALRNTQIADNKIRCSNCKCWRILDDFIGAKGVQVKRCKKCRDKDTRQKKKPERVLKRNQVQKEKKYYIKYREKKRLENEEEFLKHNAEVAKEWRQKNKEHLAQWQTNNFGARLRAIKQQARTKGIEWKEDLSDEMCYKMMTSPCFYCVKNPSTSLNGIDRLDNFKCYEAQNVVGCCKTCNFMKKSLDPNTFIKRCQHISLLSGQIGHLHSSAWTDSKCCSYNTYVKRCTQIGHEFMLSKNDFTNMTSSSCHYCGKPNTNTHTNGIDRVDNNKGYTLDNCVACCGECNQMKASLHGHDFVLQCIAVSQHCTVNSIKIDGVSECKRVISARNKNITLN